MEPSGEKKYLVEKQKVGTGQHLDNTVGENRRKTFDSSIREKCYFKGEIASVLMDEP